MIVNSEVLILGGSGSLGNQLVRKLKGDKPKGIRIYSRSEYLQWQMQDKLKEEGILNDISFLLGDVRDKDRLSRAMNGVDVVINCAAMKQVPASEQNPFEAVKTNVIGAQNIIDCAINNNVNRVMHISTDKCVEAVNSYGATKTVAEKLFIHANVYTGDRSPIFSCCRYGNVITSRGSVVELFKYQAKTNNRITVTHSEMTRFWITLDQVAQFIIDRIYDMKGQEIFIPKMPSMGIMDLKNAVAPGCEVDVIGIRKGEKLHETLISKYETAYLEEKNDFYVLNHRNLKEQTDFCYSSDNNEWQLSVNELKEIIKE